ncbi:MAG: hypothetical protein AAGA56_18925 [Myxococcota bacterium]
MKHRPFTTTLLFFILVGGSVGACGDDHEQGGETGTGTISSSDATDSSGDGGSGALGDVCLPPSAICDGECIDLSRSVDNCGGCGEACEARAGFDIRCVSFDGMDPVCVYECAEGTVLNTLTGMCE